MKKKESSHSVFFPSKQEKLYYYEKYFELFTKLFTKNLLPKKILLTGQSGIGKATFAYHLINFILSKNEDFYYDIKNYQINPKNKSFRLVSQNSHPNFFLIDSFNNKQIIDINQIREMIIYTNHTSYQKNIKFILVNNAEYLNQQSVNALLKVVEQPSADTFFIFVQNSAKNMISTLKSRCIEFKISFTRAVKKKIFTNLSLQHDLKINPEFIDEFTSYYDSPGTLLNIVKIMEDFNSEENNLNLINLIDHLIKLNLKNKNNLNIFLLQYFIEFFYSKKITATENKNKIYFNYSKAINQLNLFKKYNIDMNNVFYELKENIIHV